MVDPIKIVQTWLLGSSSVTSLLGTSPGGGVYGGADLPEKFDPTLGPAVQIYVSTGSQGAEIIKEVMPRVAIKCWADVNEYEKAQNLYRAVYDIIHGANNVDFGDDGRVISAQAATQPQNFTDPDTSWVCAFGFFTLDIIQTAPASLSDFVDSGQTVKQYIDSLIADLAGIDDNL